nr:hypothetical protein [Thecaphora frezii]
MRYASLSAAILASLVTTGTSVLATPIYQELALRQNADANGLLESLRNNNLTRLADVLANHTAVTDAIFADDSAKYFLAPNNEAVAGLPEWVTSNSSRLEATLLQHVLRGNFNPDDFNTFPLHTLGHSLLTSKDFARLPGGAGQALALSKVSNGSIVAEAVNNDTFVGAPANFNRITIQPISHAVTVPGTVIETLQYLQYGLLLQTLSGVNNGSLIKHLDEISGITVFAPTNKAITAFLASKPNTTELPAVLGQHVVMNRVLYSPLLIDQGAIISASGQDVKFDNEQGTLTVDGKSARILQADIICSNGVIHSIDAVIASGARRIERARSNHSVDRVDHSVRADNVGLQDPGRLAVDRQRALLVVELDVLARRRDDGALIDQQRRVEDAVHDNVLAEHGGKLGRVGLRGQEGSDRLVGRREDGNTRDFVQVLDEATIVDTRKRLQQQAVLEVLERLDHRAGNRDGVRDGLDGDAVEVGRRTDKGVVVDRLSDD